MSIIVLSDNEALIDSLLRWQVLNTESPFLCNNNLHFALTKLVPIERNGKVVMVCPFEECQQVFDLPDDVVHIVQTKYIPQFPSLPGSWHKTTHTKPNKTLEDRLDDLEGRK